MTRRVSAIAGIGVLSVALACDQAARRESLTPESLSEKDAKDFAEFAVTTWLVVASAESISWPPIKCPDDILQSVDHDSASEPLLCFESPLTATDTVDALHAAMENVSREYDGGLTMEEWMITDDATSLRNFFTYKGGPQGKVMGGVYVIQHSETRSEVIFLLQG